MSAPTIAKRHSTHPASGGGTKRTINRIGPVLIGVGVVFFLAWVAWNAWIAAFVAHGGH